jgi:hypothetical protein
MECMRVTHETFALLSQRRANDSKCGGKRLKREQNDARVTGAPLFRHSECNEVLTLRARGGAGCK